MSLGTLQLHNPVVRMRINKGPSELTPDALNRQLLTFEFGQEKGKRIRFTARFDNTNGLFNVAVLDSMRLTMTITFGYEQWFSKPYLATVRKLKAKINRSTANTAFIYPSSFGEVTIEGYMYHTGLSLEPQELSEKGYQAFYNMKLSQAVYAIAKRKGYADRNIYIRNTLIDGSPEPIEETIQLAGYENVEQFLRRRAAERDFDFNADNKSFHFHDDGYDSFGREHVITYFEGPDVLDMEVEGDYSINMDSVNGKTINGNGAANASIAANNKGAAGSLFRSANAAKRNAKAGNRQELTKDSINERESVTAISDKLYTKSLTRLQSRVNDKWSATLKLVGNPDIEYHSLLQLKNFGILIDGTWIVTKFSHLFDTSGYTTSVTAKRIKGSGIGKNGKSERVVGLGASNEGIASPLHIIIPTKPRGK